MRKDPHPKSLTETAPGLLAVLVAAKRTGDEALEAAVEIELKRRFDIEVRFGDRSPIQREAAAT